MLMNNEPFGFSIWVFPSSYPFLTSCIFLIWIHVGFSHFYSWSFKEDILSTLFIETSQHFISVSTLGLPPISKSHMSVHPCPKPSHALDIPSVSKLPSVLSFQQLHRWSNSPLPPFLCFSPHIWMWPSDDDALPFLVPLLLPPPLRRRGEQDGIRIVWPEATT